MASDLSSLVELLFKQEPKILPADPVSKERTGSGPTRNFLLTLGQGVSTHTHSSLQHTLTGLLLLFMLAGALILGLVNFVRFNSGILFLIVGAVYKGVLSIAILSVRQNKMSSVDVLNYALVLMVSKSLRLSDRFSTSWS